MQLKLQSKIIPQKPGVYFFFGGKSKILYVGKAGNLRARLGSYLPRRQAGFREAKLPLGSLASKSPKTAALINETNKVGWEILDSEAEALIKEAEYIKKYRPKYNVLMRDDKQYLYVGFTREKFPKVFLTHQPNKIINSKFKIRNKSKKFKIQNSKISDFVLRASNFKFVGPFTEASVLKSVLKSLRKDFPYCTCLPAGRPASRPHKGLCLNARIGRCLGYCCNKTANYKLSTINYSKNISAIKKILSGKNKALLKELKKGMRLLSREQKYEEAAKVRDQIKVLERIFSHSRIIRQDAETESRKAVKYIEQLLKIKNLKRIEVYDIANIQGKFAYGSMAVFIGGKPDKNQYRVFKIKRVGSANDPAMIKEVLERRLKHREWPYPEAIIVDGGKPQLNAALKTINYKLKTKVIALTKNKKHVGDHIFIAGSAKSISLNTLPYTLKNLILHLDSEAHRFAIKHYRALHRKTMLDHK